jgi:hypothetical protein
LKSPVGGRGNFAGDSEDSQNTGSKGCVRYPS